MIVTILAQYLCPQAKEVEKTAIEEGIRENGAEDSDKVIQPQNNNNKNMLSRVAVPSIRSASR